MPRVIGGNSALAAAIHEAGHAVATLVLHGPWIRSVWIKRVPLGWDGLVDSDAAWQPWMADVSHSSPDAGVRVAFEVSARNDCVMFMAGPLAEARHCARSWRGTNEALDRFSMHCIDEEPAPGSDMDRVRARLLWLSGHDYDLFESLWIDAEKLLRSHWGRVVNLGQWLSRERVISDAALYAWWDSHSDGDKLG